MPPKPRNINFNSGFLLNKPAAFAVSKAAAMARSILFIFILRALGKTPLHETLGKCNLLIIKYEVLI